MMSKIKKVMGEEETEYIDTVELEKDAQEFDEDFNVRDNGVNSAKRNIVKIYEPVSKTTVDKMMDSIKRSELCIVNFKNISEEEGNQVLNQLSGVVYALDGQLIQVSGEIIVCAPKNYILNTDGSN